MKKVILLFLFITGTLKQTLAQTSKEDTKSTIFFRDIKTNFLPANSSNDSLNKIDFTGSIKFLDARFDTSYIGYMLDFGQYKRLAIKEGLCNYFSSRIIGGGSSKTNAGTNLLCIIHNFTLIESDSLEEKEFRKGNLSNKLSVKIDVFAEQNKLYRAVFRYDTVLVELDDKRKHKLNNLYNFNQAFAAKINRTNLNNLSQKKQYTFSDIVESVQEKYNLPILKDTLLKKGVYLSLNDFTQNNPSYSNYEIRKEKLADDLYITNKDGVSELTRNAFGYCDGKNIWIWLANNFFLLHRRENDFEFYGFNWLLHKKNNTDNFNLRKSTGNDYSGLITGSIMSLAFDKDKIDAGFFRPFILEPEKGNIF